MTQEALKQALDVLQQNHHLIEKHEWPEYLTHYDRVISAVTKALEKQPAQPQQEPYFKFRECEDSQAEQPQQEPDYAWPTVADYEKDVGIEVNQVFKMAWNMARTTNKMMGITSPPQRKPLEDAVRRAGFQKQEDEWTFRGMTAWQIWQKACDWNEAAHNIKE